MPYTTVLYLLLKIILSISLDKIPQTNQLIEEAGHLFLQQNYALALVKYETLHNDLHIKDIHMRLNLAHCYFQVGDSASARKRYLPYIRSVNPEVRTVVCQQLGVMAFASHEYKQALTYFKQALLADPQNQAARYNFELAKKLISQADTLSDNHNNLPEPAPEPERNPDSDDLVPQAAEPNKNPQQGIKPQKKELTRKEVIRERLDQINISEDKARMILDAMKQTEIQYIQQHKKTGSKKQQKDLPDW